MTDPTELKDKIIELIPEASWTVVKKTLITAIVDGMPGSVLLRLTGDPYNFDQAEQILIDYYELPDKAEELIIDAIKLLTPLLTLELLNNLNLQQIIDDGIPEADASALSNVQGGGADHN